MPMTERGEQVRPTETLGPRTMPSRPMMSFATGSFDVVTLLQHWTGPVEHEDGEQLFAVEGAVEAGRPAGATPGADMRSVLAVSGEVQFGRPGGYVVRAYIGDSDGGSARNVSFRVHFPGAVQAPPPGGPADFSL